MVLSLLARQELFLSVLSFTSKTQKTPRDTDTAAVLVFFFFFLLAVCPLSHFETMAAYAFKIQACVKTRYAEVVSAGRGRAFPSVALP